ncbi:MAG: cupin domain-containing protein [Desulfobacterales bacterium]|nr:cupin domain-containing protein [Desulfobacterales bacterium]
MSRESGGNPHGLRGYWFPEKTVGAKNLAMGVNETYPGGMVPEHKHDHEEEVMFFLAGRGMFVTPDREIPLEPGVCIYNPPGNA